MGLRFAMLLFHEVLKRYEFGRFAAGFADLRAKSVAVAERLLSLPQSDYLGHHSSQHLDFALAQQTTAVVEFGICEKDLRARWCVQAMNQSQKYKTNRRLVIGSYSML